MLTRKIKIVSSLCYNIFFISILIMQMNYISISYKISRILKIKKHQYNSFEFCYKNFLTTHHIQDTSFNENKINNNNNTNIHLFSVAPMMDYTDKHQRTLQRMITKQSVLYTEMVTCNALVRSDNHLQFLDCQLDIENPIVLQLGGSDPSQMRNAAKMAYNYGYREININCGCPSEKVADNGLFGAALMLQV